MNTRSEYQAVTSSKIISDQISFDHATITLLIEWDMTSKWTDFGQKQTLVT